MATVNAATWIGSISVLLWGTLALLTKLSGGDIPEFQLMAMTFGIAFLLMGGLGSWLAIRAFGIYASRRLPGVSVSSGYSVITLHISRR
jgi:hypothetical protein